MQILWVGIIVLITVLTVLGIDYATKVTSFVYKITMLAGVLLINVSKFVVWGYIHKHFPFGTSYAMASSFYPIIYIISILMDTVTPTGLKSISVMLILTGVVLISLESKKEVQ